MPKKIIQTPHAPRSALYSQGVKAGSTIYVSGMVGADPSTGELAGSTVQEQTLQALANCEQVVIAGGATRRDIVEVGVLLASPDDFAGLNEAYSTFFLSDPPTRCVAKLGVELPNVRVSVRMTAVIS